LLINKAIKQNKKLRKRVVKKFNNYYWTEVPLEDAIKRVRIVEGQFNSKDDILNYSRKELDNHINIMEELPYEMQLIKYSNREGGALIFKSDHTMSDGLGMISLTLTLADSFSEDIIPNILKLGKNIPFYLKIVMEIVDFFLFPYYAIRLLLNGKVNVSEENPFKRPNPPSGLSLCDFTQLYDFTKFHELNRKLNISFNDLMLAIVSAGIDRYCKSSESDKDYVFSKLVCAIPIGIKSLAHSAKDVGLENDILGAITVLKRIKDPLSEYNKICEETKKTVKNTSNIKAWRYLQFIFNQFLPYFVQKGIAKTIGASVDIGVTSLPGPTGEICYCGSEVTEILPMMSLGFGKFIIIVGTYNNKLRFTACADKGLNIDLKHFTNSMDEVLAETISKIE